MSREFLNSLLDFFFPVSCFFCHQPKNKNTNPAGVICVDCEAKIDLNAWIFCPICNKKITTERTKTDGCEKHRTVICGLGAAANYNDPYLKPLILRYKYDFHEKFGDIFSDILFRYFENLKNQLGIEKNENWVVTFIPLSAKKERWRGFNQSKIIAKKFAQKTGLNFITTLRRKNTQISQAHLKSKEKRLQNIKESFQIDPDITVKNLNVILIDDVCATGATLLEAGKILKKNGVKNIFGLVLARKN
ncbi:MAG: hypothetical protein A2418_01635 [Candidatus Brennerbacteria bacterium RIFOXYC1_FULL_41_11]|uniref:Phosphoribosyltransferase domain-containing protein n=1 Tax=Candidatus Brennerbacteria bacterium RIFOXYD1_FULL_41_16 TaxID=1797529 RepID=A0A1G1XK74_9BACT|nr:MAG: hypothetical protein A2418_01635 [Candidatus Brennerbacteria bacterium RIFOXYC1_FULL_41_11]OGY39383.1 MAG: hypothetical protein A2391_02825 [Candidatus Brennerbacteria bacterium RIFOXYB1_FULL_41_13]OGY40010.1 MAG: hypothetical protein A2570_00775 [Candidatus Brennerbacteria bacterium RIFOXYD1_FULL_41_16]